MHYLFTLQNTVLAVVTAPGCVEHTGQTNSKTYSHKEQGKKYIERWKA